MAEALEVTPAELDAFADRLGEVESYLHLDEKAHARDRARGQKCCPWLLG